jgi:hypothetical protein
MTENCTDEDDTTTDTYLTSTCKGTIPVSSSSSSSSNSEDDTNGGYYNAMRVIPSGYQPVLAVQLQFEHKVQIQSIRWLVQ